MTKIIPLFLLLCGFHVFGQTVIYSTGFQNGIPNEFTLIDNDLNIPATQVSEFDAAWICVSDPENPMDSIAASTSYFNVPDTADRWMITPSLALGSFGNKFYWNAKSQDASFPDDYYVLVSVTDNSPDSFLDTVGYIEGENFEWTERSIDLSDLGYDNQSIFLAFVLRTYDGFKLYIDDIEAVKEDETGIDENISFSMNIYPVPVKETLNVSTQATISAITISNTQGAIIYQGNSISVDVSRFPRGTYFIKVETDLGTAAKLFIKQ